MNNLDINNNLMVHNMDRYIYHRPRILEHKEYIQELHISIFIFLRDRIQLKNVQAHLKLQINCCSDP